MTSVTFHDPAAGPMSAEAPAAAPPVPPGAVRDARGRVLTTRKIGPLERMRLFKALGPALSANQEYLGIAMLAFTCTSIDGEKVVPPATEAEMEFLVQRLDDDGINALGKAQIAAMGVTDEEISAAGGDLEAAMRAVAARKQAETVAAAKN